MATLSSGHFVLWPLRPLATSSSGHFDLWPFRPLALMNAPFMQLSGHFELWPTWTRGSYELRDTSNSGQCDLWPTWIVGPNERPPVGPRSPRRSPDVKQMLRHRADACPPYAAALPTLVRPTPALRMPPLCRHWSDRCLGGDPSCLAAFTEGFQSDAPIHLGIDGSWTFLDSHHAQYQHTWYALRNKRQCLSCRECFGYVLNHCCSLILHNFLVNFGSDRRHGNGIET